MLNQIKRGDTLEFGVQYGEFDEDGVLVTPEDITGYIFTITMKKDPEALDVDADLQHSQENTTDPETGYILMQVPASLTALLPLGVLW